jgi:predicted thioesterase
MVPGLTGKAEIIVGKKDLFKKLDSSIDVLSTYRVIELLESAAINAIKDFLKPGQLSLGISFNIRHLSPTPLGMKVTGHALLNRVENNRLMFLVNAYDENGKIAEGEHERKIIMKENFIRRLEAKRHK